MPEGKPSTKPAGGDAAHFLVRMVRRYPHQVTIYAGGPLTDLALAESIDPDFASLSRELVVMGGSIHPQTKDPEFLAAPHREFNFWMDPEAAHRVLRAAWPQVTVTTVDVSVKTRMTKALIAEMGRSGSPTARYAAKYAQEDYLWDELAAMAWLDPSIVTRSAKLVYGCLRRSWIYLRRYSYVVAGSEASAANGARECAGRYRRPKVLPGIPRTNGATGGSRTKLGLRVIVAIVAKLRRTSNIDN